MLLKKYPQKNCRIGNRNERIQTSRLLNQNCAVALELESMLLSIPLQIPFSTASVKMRRTHIEQMSSAFAPISDIEAGIKGGE